MVPCIKLPARAISVLLAALCCLISGCSGLNSRPDFEWVKDPGRYVCSDTEITWAQITPAEYGQICPGRACAGVRHRCEIISYLSEKDARVLCDNSFVPIGECRRTLYVHEVKHLKEQIIHPGSNHE